MLLPRPADAAALPSPRTIQEGDLVIVYENFASIKSVYIDSNAQFQNRFGTFNHKDWIGQPYGSKVHCRPPGRGWVYILAPTPELWTLVLRHRTQILYVADISLVISNLALKPGKVVLESGTGSGSLTHSLARAVAPTGHVHTFDFHKVRAIEARSEFNKHGLGGIITVQQRNIEEQGFPEDLAGQAHALFLDLPGPWKVVPSAANCLESNGRFCSFSPCIEQVQRTCEALDCHGFTDIKILEVLLRTYDVSVETLHTNTAQAQQPNKQGKKRRRQPLEGQQQNENGAVDQSVAMHATIKAAEIGNQAAAADKDASSAAAPVAAAQQVGAGQETAAATARQVLAKPLMEARGHTGYLTFARKFVAGVQLGGDAAAAAEEPVAESANNEAVTDADQLKAS